MAHGPWPTTGIVTPFGLRRLYSGVPRNQIAHKFEAVFSKLNLSCLPRSTAQLTISTLEVL